MFKLELERVIEEVKANDAKRVLVQLPDGLKPRANEVVDAIEELGVEVVILFGGCYGACDLPLGMESLKIDLVVAF